MTFNCAWLHTEVCGYSVIIFPCSPDASKCFHFSPLVRLNTSTRSHPTSSQLSSSLSLRPQPALHQIRSFSRQQPSFSSLAEWSQSLIRFCSMKTGPTRHLTAAMTRPHKNKPTSSPSTPSNVRLVFWSEKSEVILGPGFLDEALKATE